MKINTENFDFEKINDNVLNMMTYLYNYIEDGWKIKKRDNCYIIYNNHSKIYTLDNLNFKNNNTEINDKNKYILAFLFNGLNNGWTIKKNNKKYIFYKNHEGKKEIFLDNYINTFLKENFNFNLIK
jgi:hypothetical protein